MHSLILKLHPFRYPRLLRYVVRQGLGGNEFDAENAMYSCLKEKFGEQLPVEVQRYIDDKDATRESVLAMLQAQVSPTTKASQAKQLLIAMPTGMKVNAFLRKYFEFDEDLTGETAEWLYDLEAGLKWCRDELMTEFAAEAKQVSSSNAAASLLAFFYMDRERWVLDRIMSAAASVGRADAPENDGIFAVGDVDKILEPPTLPPSLTRLL